MYPVSRIVPKTLRRDPLGVFNIHSDANSQKIEGGPFGDLKKVRKNLTKLKLYLNSENVICEL